MSTLWWPFPLLLRWPLAHALADLEPEIRLLAENRWPWRLHATYDETIDRALDVFEKVDRDVPLSGINWFFDHAETISDRNIDRVAALGGGIAVQHRMAFQGEFFVERYGAKAAERTPPIRQIMEAGVPVGAGTDATRVASYNPWVSLSWLVTSKTVGGLALYPQHNRLDRETALRLWTEANTWFSNEEGKKGQIKAGQFADLAVLSDDYFSVRESDIVHLRSVLTILGGKVVHGDSEYERLAPDLPAAMPDWSPVRSYGGYQKRADAAGGQPHALAIASACVSRDQPSARSMKIDRKPPSCAALSSAKKMAKTRIARKEARTGASREKGSCPFSMESRTFFSVASSVLLSLSGASAIRATRPFSSTGAQSYPAGQAARR
jgi:hypothetical protein